MTSRCVWLHYAGHSSDIVVVTAPPKPLGQRDDLKNRPAKHQGTGSGQNIDKPKNDRDVERAVKAVTLQVTPEQAENWHSLQAKANSNRQCQFMDRETKPPQERTNFAVACRT